LVWPRKTGNCHLKRALNKMAKPKKKKKTKQNKTKQKHTRKTQKETPFHFMAVRGTK
jgi:hypothetical protein